MSVSAQQGADRYEARFTWFSVAGAGVWLIFLAPVVQEAWARRTEPAGWLAFLTFVVFCALYLYCFVWARPRRHRGEIWSRVDPRALGFVGLMLLLTTALVLTVHAAGLAAVVYVGVAGVTLLPWRVSLPLAVVLALGSEALARTVPGWDGAEGISLSVGLAVFAVWGIWSAMRRSRELVAAQEENAQLVIGQERDRMARDLHDILGHSLTVIAVKAELADRLLDVSPERARSEIADIQRLSRDALADVRRTVHDTRELSLPGEITRARAALDAAEIQAELPGSTDEVPSALRELFAWTLREGVTNVVRHSQATRCTVTLDPDRITIADNGRGMPAADAGGGRGLSGLRARVAAAGAQLVVYAPPEGGFSLSVVAKCDQGPAREPNLGRQSLRAEPSR